MDKKFVFVLSPGLVHNFHPVSIGIENYTFIISITGGAGFINNPVAIFFQSFCYPINFFPRANINGKVNDSGKLFDNIVFGNRNPRHFHDFQPALAMKRKKIGAEFF